MSEMNQATDWRELSEFAGVDLDKSFVLSWHFASETLLVDVDLLLTETHPFYEKPRPAEKICIRPAIVEFPFCERITVDGNLIDAGAEAAERIGHGAIQGLRRMADSRYEISGDFGTVLIAAERPLIRMKGP